MKPGVIDTLLIMANYVSTALAECRKRRLDTSTVSDCLLLLLLLFTSLLPNYSSLEHLPHLNSWPTCFCFDNKFSTSFDRLQRGFFCLLFLFNFGLRLWVMMSKSVCLSVN